MPSLARAITPAPEPRLPPDNIVVHNHDRPVFESVKVHVAATPHHSLHPSAICKLAALAGDLHGGPFPTWRFQCTLRLESIATAAATTITLFPIPFNNVIERSTNVNCYPPVCSLPQSFKYPAMNNLGRPTFTFSMPIDFRVGWLTIRTRHTYADIEPSQRSSDFVPPFSLRRAVNINIDNPASAILLQPVHIVAPRSRSWLTLIVLAISISHDRPVFDYHHCDTASVPRWQSSWRSSPNMSGVSTAPRASESIAAAPAITFLHIPDCSSSMLHWRKSRYNYVQIADLFSPPLPLPLDPPLSSDWAINETLLHACPLPQSFIPYFSANDSDSGLRLMYPPASLGLTVQRYGRNIYLMRMSTNDLPFSFTESLYDSVTP
ncbi:hypothetical protein GALMADRAFT_133964 [Galerina marginata CBS 339.88]|uniref:Uncharacterized protein n=1 Tax=Galerina marginata (strain CBS 339.88) TaxID=685588 RepID=A0A067TGH4_GALM3|nr:hypothetical protein GALMADRAFT_133964 [Galerina marginata CBS 339.88]